MKIPYWYQGMIFAPVLVGLLFILKITCPAPTGVGCFADPFLVPVFSPLVGLYKIFGNIPAIAQHEPLIILLYWSIVGTFAGLCLDVYKRASK
jgi:hypothetical protein